MDRPTGAIPRVEAQRAHRDYIETVEPETAMIDLTHARHLLNRDPPVTAASHFPDRTCVITTTTVGDGKLARLSWEAERDLVTEFGPEYHVPTDYPVYGDDAAEERLERARKCAAGSVWMADALAEAGSETAVIPLIKGATREEREEGYRASGATDADLAALYVSQYFSVSGSGGHPAIIRDLEAIETERPGLDIAVIGMLSPYYLDHLPSNVVAVAGQNAWRERVKPRTRDDEGMREAHAALVEGVERALGGDREAADADTTGGNGGEGGGGATDAARVDDPGVADR